MPPMMLDQGSQCELESLLPYITSPDDENPDSPRSLQEPVLPSDTDTDVNQRRRSGVQSDDSCEKPPLTPSDEETNNSSGQEDHWKAREAAMEYTYPEDHVQSDGSGKSNGSRDSVGSNGPPPSYRKAMARSGSSGSGSSSDGVTGTGRARKMRNLEEILQQIDKQAKALVNLKSPLRSSPRLSNSDENHSSETEVDRHVPRGSFYKQSDSDKDNSPSGRPPPLFPRAKRKSPSPPKVPPHPQRHYGPLQIHIPGFGPAIGAVSPQRQSASPSTRRSPPQLGKHVRKSPSPLSRTSHRWAPKECGVTRKVSPPGSVDLHKEPTLIYVAPKLQSPPKFGTPLTDFSPTGYGGPVYGTPVYESTTTNTGSPVHKPQPHGSPHASPKRHASPNQSGGQSPPIDPLTAIPYRGGKNGSGSIPGSPPQGRHPLADLSSDDNPSEQHSPKPPQCLPEQHSPKPPKCPPKPHRYINKVTHPLLDGYPLKQHSITTDGQSEGYHSDKTDDALFIREIVTEEEEPEVPNRRDSYNLSTSSTERVDL